MRIADVSVECRSPLESTLRRQTCAAVALALLVLLAPGAAVAQSKPAPQAKPKAPAVAAKAPQAVQPQMPDSARLAIMIQNTLLALNQANLTGNYSVMRDLATPSFQAANL